MRRLLCLLFAVLATNAFALDHMWDMRYTFGPESRPSPKMGFGLGIRSPFNSNVLFPINFTRQLNKKFDVGTKLDINTYNKLDEIHTALDIGGLARCFANYYELRAGFLEGATGKDGYAKFSAAVIPTIVFGQIFRLFLEVNTSASVGHFRDDFMVDIIPKMELTFGGTHIRIDFDVGVMQEKNNNVKTIGLYVMTAL